MRYQISLIMLFSAILLCSCGAVSAVPAVETAEPTAPVQTASPPPALTQTPPPRVAATDTPADESQWIAGVPNRMTLFCVAHLDGQPVGADALAKAAAAAEQVRTHRFFADAGLDRGAGPAVVAGCPSAATLNTPAWGGRTVAAAGPVQTYVFIASADALQATPFKAYPRVVGQEQMCQGDVCNSVANAVYITPEELNNQDTLVQALTAGLGLPLDTPPPRDGR